MWFLACVLSSVSPDDALLASLEHAAGAGLTPEQAAAHVPREATLSSLRPADRLALQAADLVDDPAHAPLPAQWRDAPAVMYWVRPLEEAGNPRLAGLLWHPGGAVSVFYAEILPP